MENGKLNGHANGSVANSAAKSSGSADEVEAESSSDGTKQAFLSLEQPEQQQAKASVMEVFKKVNAALEHDTSCTMRCLKCHQVIQPRGVFLLIPRSGSWRSV